MKHILSLGAGVQSSAMALMAMHGEILPNDDLVCVFSDTQAEPKSVYKHLEWLKEVLPFPVITVSAGSLTEKSLKPFKRKKDGMSYMAKEIPLFGILPNGKKTGAIGRQCTNDFKIQPIYKFLKKHCGIKRGQKEVTVSEWIGISWDEMQRMRDSRVPWSEKRYPLIEKRMTRVDCKKWLKKNGYPEPPRSACYYCPFHNNEDWRYLRDNEPDEFQKAIDFDKEIRKQFLAYDKMKMPVFLHQSCKPLDEVDLRTDEEKGQLTWDFKAECQGLCGT